MIPTQTDYRFQKQRDRPTTTPLPGSRRRVSLDPLGRRVRITSTRQSVLPTDRTPQLLLRPCAHSRYPLPSVGPSHRQMSMKLCGSSIIKGTFTYTRDKLYTLIQFTETHMHTMQHSMHTDNNMVQYKCHCHFTFSSTYTIVG